MAIRNEATLPVLKEGELVVTKQVPPYFKGSVVARCIEQKFGNSSSSGKPMITLGYEILVPERYQSEFDGKTYDLTSTPFKVYLSLSETDKKGNPSDNIEYMIRNLLPKLGLPAEFDDANPLLSDSNPKGLNFVGLLCEVLLSAKEKIEQRKTVSGEYEEIKDSQGNTISKGWEWNMVDKKDILGLAQMGTAVAAATESRPF